MTERLAIMDKESQFKKIFDFKLPCEQQVLIELAINSGDFW
jgi:hypothetical protein